MSKVRLHSPNFSRRTNGHRVGVSHGFSHPDHLPSALLTIAQSLIDQEHFNISVVTSHMACEVAAERALDAAYTAKQLESLREAVEALMNGHNLANDKHRKLYNALTGTELEKQPFWLRFKAASEKRNSVVHKGGHASKADAEAALNAGRELIKYLNQL